MKIFFLISIVTVLLVSTTSCTTDSYDKDMEAYVIQTTDTTISTDPIIIPKKD